MQCISRTYKEASGRLHSNFKYPALIRNHGSTIGAVRKGSRRNRSGERMINGSGDGALKMLGGACKAVSIMCKS